MLFARRARWVWIRHLRCEEIVAQVFYVVFEVEQLEMRNIVFMGMGEPFDNYEAVMQAVAVLTDMGGLGFWSSRITISTSGKVDAILRMSRDADLALNLAVSGRERSNG